MKRFLTLGLLLALGALSIVGSPPVRAQSVGTCVIRSGGSAPQGSIVSQNCTPAATSNGSFTLTPASPAGVCTALEAGPHTLLSVTNGTNLAQIQTLLLFDEGANPTCSPNDRVWMRALTGSEVIQWTFGLPLTNGLAYLLTGALTTGQNLKLAGF